MQILIIKQDIRIYVPYSRPNGWKEWAFCGHAIKIEFIFFVQNFFIHFFPRATPGPSASSFMKIITIMEIRELIVM